MRSATKSTFYLSDSRRALLKAIAAERHTTVTELLAEGADLVIDRYRGLADRDELARRAERARERLRKGLYEGPAVANDADALLYNAPKEKPARHKGRTGSSRR